MLQLGDITLREEEVERVEWRDGTLTLRPRWRFEELPVLLDLPLDGLVSWHAEDDPEARIPVRVATSRWEAGRGRPRRSLKSKREADPVEPPQVHRLANDVRPVVTARRKCCPRPRTLTRRMFNLADARTDGAPGARV